MWSSSNQGVIRCAFPSWIRGPSPSATRSKPRRVTSHPVAASHGCTIISHARDIGLGKAGPTLITAYCSHKGKRSAHSDPTRLIEPRGFRVLGHPFRSDNLECSTFRQLAKARVTPQCDHVLDNVAQSEVPFGLTISREGLRAGDRAKAEGLKPSSRAELATPAGNGGDHDPAAQYRPTAQPRGGL